MSAAPHAQTLRNTPLTTRGNVSFFGNLGYEQLRLNGLEADKQYNLVSREQLLRVGMFGGLVRHIVPVELNPNRIVLRTADRHYPMADGVERMTASGGALMSRVMLSPRFQGTGYNKDGRNQGDFCSNIYVVEKCES